MKDSPFGIPVTFVFISVSGIFATHCLMISIDWNNSPIRTSQRAYESHLFEVITSKSTKADAIPEFSPYAIYPNPTSDFINIELASNVLDDDIIEFLKHYGINNIEDCETIQINIFDVNSRLVNIGKYKYDTLISIDVKNYPSGTYLVEIKGCYDNVMQTKIVKL